MFLTRSRNPIAVFYRPGYAKKKKAFPLRRRAMADPCVATLFIGKAVD
jgi:hypothetical protein